MDPADALRAFLEALGIPPARIPGDADGRAALYRSVLAPRRMLLVLDNARDAQQVRPLLPGASASVVLVTSRDQLLPLIATEGIRCSSNCPAPPTRESCSPAASGRRGWQPSRRRSTR